jgi:hypothetical protein
VLDTVCSGFAFADLFKHQISGASGESIRASSRYDPSEPVLPVKITTALVHVLWLRVLTLGLRGMPEVYQPIKFRIACTRPSPRRKISIRFNGMQGPNCVGKQLDSRILINERCLYRTIFVSAIDETFSQELFLRTSPICRGWRNTKTKTNEINHSMPVTELSPTNMGIL